MAEFTLLKLQLDDASFSANAPFASTGDADEEYPADEAADDSPSVLPFFVGLLFLIVVAVAVRKFLGGSEESTESPDI